MRRTSRNSLLRIAYDCVLGVGLDPQRLDMTISQSGLEGGRLYTIDCCYRRISTERWFAIHHFQHRPGYSTQDALKHFRWMLKNKARWLRDGKRVKRQKFFDCLWYTAGWLLNKNPYCLCWAVVEQRDSADRAIFIKWGSQETPIIRLDKLTYLHEDFQRDPQAIAQSISEHLRLISEAVTYDAARRGRTPVRQSRGPKGPPSQGPR